MWGPFNLGHAVYFLTFEEFHTRLTGFISNPPRVSFNLTVNDFFTSRTFVTDVTFCIILLWKPVCGKPYVTPYHPSPEWFCLVFLTTRPIGAGHSSLGVMPHPAAISTPSHTDSPRSFSFRLSVCLKTLPSSLPFPVPGQLLPSVGSFVYLSSLNAMVTHASSLTRKL